MVAFHPFSTAPESVLAMWSPAAQARRQVPDARLPELFVLLHGMLFTNIQLDDFKHVLERFQEKLEIGGKLGGLFSIYRCSLIVFFTDGEHVEEREWIMMALINIFSLLEYSRPTGVLRRVAGIETRGIAGPNLSPTLPNGVSAGRIKVLMAKRLDGDNSRMEVDDEDGDEKVIAGEMLDGSAPTAEELPAALRFAMQLTFVMFSHTLRYPSPARGSTPRRPSTRTRRSYLPSRRPSIGAHSAQALAIMPARTLSPSRGIHLSGPNALTQQADLSSRTNTRSTTQQCRRAAISAGSSSRRSCLRRLLLMERRGCLRQQKSGESDEGVWGRGRARGIGEDSAEINFQHALTFSTRYP